jgi:hypothetical protein
MCWSDNVTFLDEKSLLYPPVLLLSIPLDIDEPGDVAARMRQARNEAAADRIGNVRENNGDGMCLLQQRERSRCVLRQNEVGLSCDHFPSKSLRHCIGGSPTSVDSDIAALRPADLLEPILERRDPSLSFLAVFGKRHQHADPPHALGLLRACCARPHRRAAE